jgi:hypothetical protein
LCGKLVQPLRVESHKTDSLKGNFVALAFPEFALRRERAGACLKDFRLQRYQVDLRRRLNADP